MISVQQAIEILKSHCPEREIETVGLLDALGRVLAEKIISPVPSPPYTNSAMDGFIMRWQDVENANENNPVKLNIVGESSAGHPYDGTIQAGTTIRISTGAIVPKGVDTVVPIELCETKNDLLTIRKVKKKHQHVRFAGEEFEAGQELLFDGTEIGSAQIALLASLGVYQIKVYKRPKVSIITTGSELVPFDQKAEPHQLFDSNTPMLKSAIKEAGAEVVKAIHVEDNPIKTKEIIEQAAKFSDIIISSGGVSMGVHDHVRDMAIEAGFAELFWKVRQKPGKPMFAAKKEKTLLISLPGNPVSAFMCFKHYIRPLLQNIHGRKFDWPKIKSSMPYDIENKGDRVQLMRVRLRYKQNGIPEIELLSKQGSHMPSSIAHADGYIVVDENEKITAGAMVDVFLF